MSYPDEQKLREELAPKMEEKKMSRFARGLVRNGFANTPRQAQTVICILCMLTLVGSAYFYYVFVGQKQSAPVARDPYVRPIPGR